MVTKIIHEEELVRVSVPVPVPVSVAQKAKKSGVAGVAGVQEFGSSGVRECRSAGGRPQIGSRFKGVVRLAKALEYVRKSNVNETRSLLALALALTLTPTLTLALALLLEVAGVQEMESVSVPVPVSVARPKPGIGSRSIGTIFSFELRAVPGIMPAYEATLATLRP